MPLVIKAFILCATDSQPEAEAAVFAALNGGVFESNSVIVDFATGIEQRVVMDSGVEYEDGAFLRQVPAATLLRTANAISCPV